MALAFEQRMTRKSKAAIGKGVTTEFLLITPDIANAWLDTNTKNRNVSSSIVGKLAGDMKAGRWRLTGDAIRFDRDGQLLDGQHRLIACVRADTPFKSLVIYGLEPEAQDVMDSGKSRSAADVLQLRGLTNSRRTAAALRQLIVYRTGMTASQRMISTAEIIAALEQHPNITKSVAQTFRLPKSIPTAPLSFLHYVATHLLDMPDKADAFLAVFRGGVPAYPGCPAHALRERMLHQVDSHRIRSDVTSWSVFYAWNHFVAGTPLQIFRFPKEPVEIQGMKRGQL